METHAVSIVDPSLAALAARFLKPDRSRLDELRELARRCDDVPALIEALGPGFFGPEWAAGRRWFRMSRNEADLLSVSRTVLVADGIPHPVLDRPPSKAAAVLYFSDVPAMVRAEEAAREYARRLWAATGADGAPPTEVVWRISGSGSVPSSYGGLEAPELSVVARLFEFVARLPEAPRWSPADEAWTGAFRRLAEVAALRGLWRDGVAHGLVSGADPLESLLEVWETGLGLWAVAPDHLSLFVPERADTPARSTEARHRGTARWQAARTDALVAACMREHASGRIREEIARGADPNGLSSQHGLTPLQASASYARSARDLTEKVQILIEAGADPGRSDKQGLNALAMLLRARPQGDTAPLLDAGFPVDAADLRGRTAAHQLCQRGLRPALEALLACGASVDAVDDQGMTPLHLALLHGHDALLDVLLDAGADPHRRTADGRTSYHLAAAGSPTPRVGRVCDRLARLGVPHAPDHRGWLPQDLLPEGIAPVLPPAVPAEPPPRARPAGLCRVPEGLACAVHAGEEGAWSVLGDWLQQEEDPRGDLVALALAGEAGHAPREALSAALEGCRTDLLRPFADAHPLGARLESEPRVRLGFSRGVLWELALPDSLAPALPELLSHAGTDLLNALALELPRADDLPAVLPERLGVRRLTLTVQRAGLRDPVLPHERLPHLLSLHVRVPTGVPLRVCHPTLRSLHLEQPYEPEQSWNAHEIDLPSATTLRITASRAPRLEDPGTTWLSRVFAAPPPQLASLELRPVSSALFRALLRSPMLAQIRSLTLSSVRAPQLEEIEQHADALAHLDRVEIKTLGLARPARQTEQRRLSERLPGLLLSGIDYRRPGHY